jgi:iron complex outermembrane receptor protein
MTNKADVSPLVSRKAIALGGLCFGIVTLNAPFAQAQAAVPPQTNGPVSSEDVVIVTATRRDSTIQRAPVAVTALSGSALAELGARGLEDYLRLVPGVTLNSGAGNNSNIAIRGLSTETSNANLQPTVALYINDLPTVDPQTPIGFSDLPSFDVNRVEVLRGPQGTLFGSGSLGGAIRVITNRPLYGANSSVIELRGATTDGGEGSGGVSAMGNFAIGDKAALRGVVDINRQGGIIDNPTRKLKDIDRIESQNARVAFGWKASNDLEIVATLLYLNSEPADNTLANDNTPQVLTTTINKPYETNSLTAEFVDTKIWIASVDVNWDVGFADLFSTTAFSRKDINRSRDFSELDSPLSSAFTGTPLPSEELTEISSDTWSQELRLSSKGDGNFSWLAGLFYINRLGKNAIIEGAPGYIGSGFERPGTGNLVEFVFDSESSETAAFGELSYRFNDKWRVAVSGRAYSNKINQKDIIVWALLSLGPSGTRKTKDEGAIPRFLVEYRATDQIMAYGSFSQGYRVGGLNNPQPGLPEDFDADTVDAYELGLKSRFFNRRLTLNMAAYRNNWSDIQVNEVIGGLAALTNGPAAISQGLEIEARYKASENLSLAWSGTFTDATADEDAPNVNANRGGIRRGDRLPGVAKFLSSAQIRYAHEFGGDLSGYILLDHRYFSGAYNGFNRTDALVKEIPAWSQLNVRAGLQRGPYEVVAYIENATNEDSITNVAFNGGFQRDGVARVRPLTFGLTFRGEY